LLLSLFLSWLLFTMLCLCLCVCCCCSDNESMLVFVYFLNLLIFGTSLIYSIIDDILPHIGMMCRNSTSENDNDMVKVEYTRVEWSRWMMMMYWYRVMYWCRLCLCYFEWCTVGRIQHLYSTLCYTLGYQVVVLVLGSTLYCWAQYLCHENSECGVHVTFMVGVSDNSVWYAVQYSTVLYGVSVWSWVWCCTCTRRVQYSMGLHCIAPKQCNVMCTCGRAYWGCTRTRRLRLLVWYCIPSRSWPCRSSLHVSMRWRWTLYCTCTVTGTALHCIQYDWLSRNCKLISSASTALQSDIGGARNDMTWHPSVVFRQALPND
jgi:hypothetical protein